MNKDYLRQIFRDEKKLLGLNDVKYISIPAFDELAVEKIWPMVKEDAEFARLFPDKLSKGKLPQREYFWNVLNTRQPEYVQLLVEHAMKQRNTSESKEKQAETIAISEEWWDRLHLIPFISCK